MNKLSIVLVSALAFAGCKKKGGAADCEKAIDHSMELSKADMAKMPGMDDKTMTKMRDLGLQHCKDDKWSDEVVKCMIDAKTETEGQGCYNKLSKDQQDKMNKAVMEMAPPPAAPTPAAGSDMGSADMAGSAAAGSAAAPK
jgi:hypothetical protein